jgi:integrase/recombinase XerD
VSALAEHLEDYLRMRRALGFQLGRHGQVLPHFVAWLDAAGATTVTVELAVAWARLPGERVKPITVEFRLSTVRGFAHYLHALDPAHQIPPPGLLAVPRRRPAPYLYASGELERVLLAARRMRPRLRAATYEALLGLLAVTGMRIGEALALSCDEVDLAEGIVTIRHAKFDRMRLVPLHSSVTAALRDYAAVRDRLCRTRTGPFFVTRPGHPMTPSGVRWTFQLLTTELGLRTDTVHPRVHDLRHSFAVHTLIDWHRSGVDVHAMLPVLSTYLGHVEPANTYWYLSAVPELMQLAAARLEQHQAGQP